MNLFLILWPEVTEPTSVSMRELLTILVAFHPGFQTKVAQYTATCYILITTETTEQHGNFNFFQSFSLRSSVTGQHYQQDKSLIGQIPNQSGHCPLTGRYFGKIRHLLEVFYCSENDWHSFPLSILLFYRKKLITTVKSTTLCLVVSLFRFRLVNL